MTTVRRIFLFLIFLMASLIQAYAQSTVAIISDHYTTHEGLPSDNVSCALKDRDGFLWFGTWYGLCRFDGERFVTYNKPKKTSSEIPPRKIESMTEDGRGVLWLKTVDWKLYTFHRQTEHFHAVYDELKKYTRNLQVIKIQRTDEGQVLLLTKDKTLLLAQTDSMGAVSIKKLVDASKHLDPQMQLTRDITTEAHGYVAYVGRDYRIFACRKSAKQSSHQTLAQAMDKYEAEVQQQTERLQQTAAACGIDKYTQLYEDRDGLLWVTTMAHGIYCISQPRRQFGLITLPSDDQTGVRCLYQMRNGNIIVGTRSRDVFVYRMDGQLLQSFPYSDYGIGAVYHAMEDDRGRLWLSTKGDGLVLVDSAAQGDAWKTAVHYRHNPDDASSLSGNNVYMTFCDSQHHIWVCTLDGGLNLVSEKNGQLTFYNKHHGLTHYPSYGLYTEVRNIVEDEGGTLWIGTLDGLMSTSCRFRSPSDIVFKTYRDQPDASFANNDIYTLYGDQNRQIWIGAFGGGLQKLGAGALGPREGLRNDVIYSIVEDLHGHLWLATEAGLSCYNQQTKRIRNFDRYDGIPDVKMEEASALCCTNGHLWIGCKQGILTFIPEQLQTNSTSYRTFIIDLVADNQPYQGPNAISYTDEIAIDYDDNSFTIEFAALNFQNHGSVSYRYRLEGYDRDWRYSGPHRVGSYNEVPPGRYTFVVETLDDANPTQYSSAQLSLRILPPWWATWWAYMIYMLVVLLIVWVVIRTVLQMNRMRNEVYISQRLAKLTSKPDEGDKFIDQLHRIIRKNIPNTEFNIDAIASEMGLSRSAFYKKVKSQTGFAPVDLIKEFRLSHAVELLQTTNYSITEVAFRSGFADSSYFGKCFRKRYGMSPREYIRQNEKED